MPWVSRVVLDPRIEWQGSGPSPEALEALHEEAHAQCFIASSVKTEIEVASSRQRPPAGPRDPSAER